MIFLSVYVLLASLSAIYGDILNTSLWEEEPEDCGRTRYDKEKNLIVDHSKARVGEFPWVVRVGAVDKVNNKPLFICGGTLISKRFVFSNVQCGIRAQMIRLGEYNIKTDVDCDECGECAPSHQDIKIRKHLFDENCTPQNDNDIMVMQLEKPAKLTDFVQPICLPKSPFPRSLTNDRLLAPGWGEVFPKFIGVNATYNPSDELMYLNAIKLDLEECNKVYTEPLKENDICVGYPKGVTRTCVGDSGGSLIKFVNVGNVRRAVMVGVAKYNPVMCDMEDMPPIVYSRIFNTIGLVVKLIEDVVKLTKL